MPEDIVIRLLPPLEILDKHLMVSRLDLACLGILSTECGYNGGVFGPERYSVADQKRPGRVEHRIIGTRDCIVKQLPGIRASEAFRTLVALVSQRLASSRLAATAVRPRSEYLPDSWNPLLATADSIHGQ